MRHLRLFEGFLQDFYGTDNEYYHIVGTINASNFFSHRQRAQLTDRQIEIISENSGFLLERQPGGNLYFFRDPILRPFEKPREFFIAPYDDEYYRCYSLNHTVECICDGFDGLIKFLVDWAGGKIKF